MSIYDDRMRSWERGWDEGVIQDQSFMDYVWIGVFAVLLFGEWAVRKVCRYK